MSFYGEAQKGKRSEHGGKSLGAAMGGQQGKDHKDFEVNLDLSEAMGQGSGKHPGSTKEQVRGGQNLRKALKQ